MELLDLALVGGGTCVAVFVMGVGVEVLVNRRFGAPRTRPDTAAQQHQQTVHDQLGGSSAQGDPQH